MNQKEQIAEEKKKTPQQAIADFAHACDELARQVNHRLFEDSRNWYWVANSVGGSCDFGDTDFLTPDEMVLILEHHLTYDEYADWRDANINNIERTGFINLQSWIVGLRHVILEKIRHK